MFGQAALNFTQDTKPYARLLPPTGNSSKHFFFSKPRYYGAGTSICLPQVFFLLMQHADQLNRTFDKAAGIAPTRFISTNPTSLIHFDAKLSCMKAAPEGQALFWCEYASHLPPGILYSQSPCRGNKPSS